jgi:hypothetical protein
MRVQVNVQGGCPTTPGLQEGAYVLYLRNILAGSLSDTVVNGARAHQNGLFAPACLQHCMAWNAGPTVDGKTHAMAFLDWYEGRGQAMSFDNSTDVNHIVACKGDSKFG